MHILHLIKTSDGASWAINLIEELQCKYPDLTFSVVMPVNGRHTERYARICKEIYHFEYRLDLQLFRRGQKLREIAIAEKPDIIHSWFTQTTLYARIFLRKFNIPRIFQVVGPLHLESFIFRWADILSANKNDSWVATSKYILEKYKRNGVDDSRLFLNYAYVDVNRLLQGKETIKPFDLRSRFNIPEHYKIIGTASYIYPPKFYEKTGVKGHEYLLAAFREILKVRNDIVLIIAGDVFGDGEKYLSKLKRIATTIDPARIYFLGKYDHVYKVISDFDVFVYLSKSENLGGVFESLLFEVPTVSSNKGALPELVIENETGNSVNIKDSKEISAKILQMLDNPNQLMLKMGKELVLSTFDKSTIIEKGYSIYNQILSVKTPQ